MTIMKKNAILLSDHFNYARLIRFALPSIIMMVFTSIYGVVDGFFVSNFTGKTPFAAVNFIMPFLMILGSIGFMFGTGGSALIGKTMGEGQSEKANRIFSLIVYTAIVLSILFAIFGIVFIRPVASLMGAEGELLENSVVYGRIILIALPFYVLQFLFQCLFSTAGKPQLGLYITVASGVTNMVLDALFVALFQWGLEGAAAATACSQFVGGAVPLVYFARKNSSLLKLTKCRFDGKALLKTSSNGFSEFLNNISASFIGMLFNVQLMKFAGENGISAYGVLMYVSLIFQAVFIGFTLSGAPIISYHYGARNYAELKNIKRKSLILIGIFAILMFIAGQLMARPLSILFVGYDQELCEMTTHAFSIFSFCFLPSGFVIFCSSFFTALNDGLTSALISFLRTLVFRSSCVLLFPILWELDGIWLSDVAAEVLAVAVAGLLLVGKRRKYNY